MLLWGDRRRASPAVDSISDFRVFLMRSLLWLFDTVITLYIYVLVANAIYSWLVAFNVINSRNNVVAMIGDFLYKVTEPVLAPIRRRMPDLGGIDLSPVVLIIGLIFFRMLVFELFGTLLRAVG
jgi:YggT family protein